MTTVTGRPTVVAVPTEPGTAWTVSQNDRSWPVQLDAIAVNPADGAVTARSNVRTSVAS